jgi:hypothetical protein
MLFDVGDTFGRVARQVRGWVPRERASIVGICRGWSWIEGCMSQFHNEIYRHVDRFRYGT